MKNLRKPLLILYILAIHAALFAALFLALFVPGIVPDQSWRLPSFQAEPDRYVAERHRYLDAMDAAAQSGGTVLIGDSHAETIDARMLGHDVRILAAGGDSVRHISTQIAHWQGLKTADRIIIWAGTNDLARRPPDTVAKDMEHLLRNLPQGKETFLLTLVPVRDSAKNEQVTALNHAYRKLCDETASCGIIDINPLLSGPGGTLDRKYDRGDGKHLSYAGYARIAPVIRQRVEKKGHE